MAFKKLYTDSKIKTAHACDLVHQAGTSVMARGGGENCALQSQWPRSPFRDLQRWHSQRVREVGAK